MSFNVSRVTHRQEAQKFGEEKGSKIGIIIALFLIFFWFFDSSPFGLITTFIIMGLSILTLRFYGGEMMGKRFDYYDKERSYLRSQGIISDEVQLFDTVAKMHGH